MPRVKLEEQPEYEFEHSLSVRVTDLNYGAHLANNAVVELIHEARVRLLHNLGCSEKDLGDGCTGIIMGDLVLNFKHEGFLFDVLTVKSHIGEVSRRGFRIFHKICRDDLTLALAETGLVAFNYEERNIVTIPQPFREALKACFEKK
jgi:acyl-CoA thioesterase FadM